MKKTAKKNAEKREKKLQLRPAVRWFAEQMELRLRDNDHKGGWENCNEGYLCNRLVDELQELLKTLKPETRSGHYTIMEAADVANFAMMIADNDRRRNR